jgi:hypothetical protein
LSHDHGSRKAADHPCSWRFRKRPCRSQAAGRGHEVLTIDLLGRLGRPMTSGKVSLDLCRDTVLTVCSGFGAAWRKEP